jgi:hypothetical protein
MEASMRHLVLVSISLALLTVFSPPASAQHGAPSIRRAGYVLIDVVESIQVGILNSGDVWHPRLARICSRVEGHLVIESPPGDEGEVIVDIPFTLAPGDFEAFSIPFSDDDGIASAAASRNLLVFVVPRIVVEDETQRACLQASFDAVNPDTGSVRTLGGAELAVSKAETKP